ncbi:helix-turn-helix domain-containing protein [Saccharopolyspora sp. NPDC003752]
MTGGAMGRRERKKAATCQALADAAMELFLRRGFDRVSVREIADAADGSTTTLFKHFPSKEALVFGEAVDHEAELVAAVRDRGTSGMRRRRPRVRRPGALRAANSRTGPRPSLRRDRRGSVRTARKRLARQLIASSSISIVDYPSRSVLRGAGR